MANIKSEGGNVTVYLTAYKSYVALLTQEGEADTPPTATIANSEDANFLGAGTWSYDAAGNYKLTIPGAFLTNKSHAIVSSSSNVPLHLNYYFNNEDEFILITMGMDGVASDGWLFNNSIRIDVYQN